MSEMPSGKGIMIGIGCPVQTTLGSHLGLETWLPYEASDDLWV